MFKSSGANILIDQGSDLTDRNNQILRLRFVQIIAVKRRIQNAVIYIPCSDSLLFTTRGRVESLVMREMLPGI